MQGWLVHFGELDPAGSGQYVLSSGNNSLVTSILSAGTFCGTFYLTNFYRGQVRRS
jgi:hypothetical protein